MFLKLKNWLITKFYIFLFATKIYSNFDPLRNQMTKKIMFYPSILIRYRILILIINIKIISSFFIQKLILCINNFKPTNFLIIPSSKKSSFYHNKVLTLRIINYFLNKPSLKSQISKKSNYQNPPRQKVHNILQWFSWGCPLKNDPIFITHIRQRLNKPYCHNKKQYIKQIFHPDMKIRLTFRIIHKNLYLWF